MALVTGANRGIGLEVCRQLAGRGYDVVLGSRDAAKGERAAADLARNGGTVRACQLDVTDAKSIERARTRVAAEFARLDVLVNNAAILYDAWQRQRRVGGDAGGRRADRGVLPRRTAVAVVSSGPPRSTTPTNSCPGTPVNG